MPPPQKPGRSVQNVQTPPEFIAAVKARLGIERFQVDLAASFENTQAMTYYSETDNSLEQDWSQWHGWLWLNPPFAAIRPWVAKAYSESQNGAKIAMLVPASVGSNWWDCHVHSLAHVAFLSPRLTFVGHKDPYPRDLALLLYTPYIEGGYCTWHWK